MTKSSSSATRADRRVEGSPVVTAQSYSMSGDVALGGEAPARPALANPAPGPAPVPVRAAAAPLVLVVDDEPAERDLLALILAEFGLRTVRAEDGEAALAALDRSSVPIGLALIDVMLPGMPGTELAGRIRQHHPEVQVVLMSGYDHRRPAKARLCGDRHPYLAKPVSRMTLRRTVESLLNVAIAPPA